MWSFIKVLQGEENRFNHMRIQFYAGLGARTKQPRTIAIQRRVENLDMRYYDSLITPWAYLDGLSFDLRLKANTETSQQRKNEALKRLQVVESFRHANQNVENRPEWMIVKIVPVIPLRPGERFLG